MNLISILLTITKAAIYEPLYLNDKTFDKTLKDVPVSFVMVSMAGNSYCEDIIPKFRAVAEKMKDKCKFVIVEYEESQKILEKYQIYAFASFFVFRYGRLTAEYPYERNTPAMYKYLKRVLSDTITTLETARDVHDYLEEIDSAVILSCENPEDEIVKIFSEAATLLSDLIPFAIATTPDAIQQLGGEDVPNLQLHRTEDRTIVDFPLVFSPTTESLTKWIRESRKPRYSARNAITFRDLQMDKRYTLLAFVDTSKKQSLDLFHSIMNKVVTDYGQNMSYVYTDIYDYGNMALQLGFSGTRDPCFCITHLINGELTENLLFSEKRKLNPSNVARWVGMFLNGSIKRRVVSEAIPEKQNGPFKKIVGSQFSNITMNPKADVVTLFLVGDEEDRVKAMKIVNETAIEFQTQSINTVEFYYINVDLNELAGITRSSIKECVAILWPASENKKPVLMNMSNRFILANNIQNSAITLSPDYYQDDEASLEL